MKPIIDIDVTIVYLYIIILLLKYYGKSLHFYYVQAEKSNSMYLKLDHILVD